MKAIINVSKKSAYAHYNGQTFQITSVYNTSVDVAIVNAVGMKITTSFGFEEIIICDLQDELQRAFDNYNWDGTTTYIKLQTYCVVKGYQCNVVYNCLA